MLVAAWCIIEFSLVSRLSQQGEGKFRKINKQTPGYSSKTNIRIWRYRCVVESNKKNKHPEMN